MIDQKKSGLDWSDGLIGVGGIFLGAAIPHIFDLLDEPQPKVKVWLLVFGLIGALMLGVGFNQKARK